MVAAQPVVMYLDFVDVHDVTPLANQPRQSNTFQKVLFLFAIFAPLYFAIEWLWSLHGGTESIRAMALKALVWACAMSLWFTLRKKDTGYQLVVDQDMIGAKNFKTGNWLLARSLRRGEIRTIVERENGLLLSRHGRIGTFFWGGIFVPRRLADYEYIRRVVLGWKATES